MSSLIHLGFPFQITEMLFQIKKRKQKATTALLKMWPTQKASLYESIHRKQQNSKDEQKGDQRWSGAGGRAGNQALWVGVCLCGLKAAHNRERT